ncbi:MAG: peptidase U32 family protein [Bacteroides sp.]
MRRLEVLAPAGNFACLRAAIQGGADSVFLGVGELNMRASSNTNFTVETLPEAVDICHKAGVKLYLTVNTIVYNEELEAVHETLVLAKSVGVDAIIASDQAVIVMARELGLRVHLSTQLSISNTEALKFYSHWADVAVLARELSLEQVRRITDDIREQQICGPSGELIQIEIFSHGALCMAISGKCYLSLHEVNRSANRGSCVQICRRSYELRDKETDNAIEVDNEYLMSPKDLKTIHFLNKIADAGVSILKIEGRARAPEYVLTVTQCYREAADALAEGRWNEDMVAAWDARLTSVFNRGFWNGYYLGQRLGEWSPHYGSAATEKKVQLGLVRNFYDRLSVAEVVIHSEGLHVGDSLFIIGETTGVVTLTVEELRNDAGERCNELKKGAVGAFRVPTKVRKGDKVFLRQTIVSQ